MHLFTLAVALMALISVQLCAASPAPDGDGDDDSGRHEFTFPELYKLTDRFWYAFVNYAENEAKSGSSSLFNTHVQGRVDITRKFEGAVLNTEYLFGLFANIRKDAANSSAPPALLGYPTAYRIQNFVGNRDIASASTIVNFTSPLIGTYPVEILTWMQFDQDGRIDEYDATYRNFAPLLEETLMAILPRINGASLADAISYFRKTLAASICATHAQHCTGGARQQYDSEFACRAYLTNDVRFGEAWEFGRNTLLCRYLHQNMLAYRPETHCPHIGPSGGGMCVDDIPYKEIVLEKYFLTHFLPWNVPCVPKIGQYQDDNRGCGD